MSDPAPPPRLPPGWLVRPLLRVRHTLGGAHRAVAPPVLRVLDASLGMMLTRMMAVVAELRVADALHERPQSATELASSVGADADALHRTLRFLAAHGLFRATRDGRWRNNATSELLRSDHPDSVRSWVLFQGAPWHFEMWGRADHSVRTGESGAEAAVGAPYFDWLTQHSDAQSVFDSAMAETSRLVGPALAAGYDFASCRSVCDVGGGNGSLMAILLAAHPHLRGVVHDLPEVVAGAPALLEASGVADRCEIVTGDFFVEVPEGHDRYILKAIIHDWDDESCLRILANIRRALAPGGRVIVVDQIVPDSSVDHPTLATDVLMLVLTGRGRERTAAEFAALFARAGFRIERHEPIIVAAAIELVPVGE